MLASVRTRAEVRGTTVYASDSLPLGDIEGISASPTSVMSARKHRGVSANWGSHGRNAHAMSVAIVLKSPLGGGKFKVPTHPTLEIG